MNHHGEHLGFSVLTFGRFKVYIRRMSKYERKRVHELLQQLCEQPEAFPFTELLQQKFRKYQKTQ